MPYVYDLAHSLTGEWLADVTDALAAPPDWATRAHSVGDAKVTFALRDGEPILTPDEWWTFTQHFACTAVISWLSDTDPNDKRICYAGPIVADDFDDATGHLTLECHELGAELAWRNVTGVSNYDPDGALTVTGKSKRGLARAIIAAGLNRGDSSFLWNYPVDIGPDEAGPFNLTAPHHQLRPTSEILKEIRDAADGPDVHLYPEWRDGRLVWAAKYGTPRLPGQTFEWSSSAEHSPLLVKTKRDSRLLTTGVFAAGEGTGPAKKVGLGDPADAGLAVSTPYRDRTIDFSMVKDQATLNALALGEVVAHLRPVNAKTIRLNIADGINPADYQIGSRIDAWTAGNEREPEGWTRGYLIGVKSAGLDALDLEVIP